ncbi:MAG TPA: WYL domain-containing protein, partial [Marmoricola sp.]|nr:WYL domain-containing protein [Marmoricola sp.]
MTPNTPKYVERIARLPRVFEHLAAHPDGMPLRVLADHFDVPAAQLREELLAFFAADVPPDLLMGLTRPGVLEFLGPDGDEIDPNDAEVVRIIDPRNADELGVEHVDASELALIYTAARTLLDVEPEDEDLAAAVDVLAATMFGQTAEPMTPTAAPWNDALEPIVEGQRRRLRVDIVYSRTWEAGVGQRVIEPYRLVKTRRGWEVDAGPLDEQRSVRTFLLSNVRSARLLDEPFELPDDLPSLLDKDRSTQLVRVELPQSARWAADMYAESVTVVEDGELSVVLDLELLPPVRHRLGQLLLASGPTARVVD